MEPALDITPILKHVVPYVLVMCRLAGLFIMAPLLTSAMVPPRFKGLFVMMLTTASYPLIAKLAPNSLPNSTDIFGLIPLILFEAIVGFCIGAIAALPLLALEMAGILAGTNMGFGLARVYNPEQDFDTDILGQLFFYIGAGGFIAFGGIDSLFRATLASFETIPLGTFSVAQTPLDLFVRVLSSGFELAMRVSAPVTGIVALLVVTFGVIGKSMPQVNIMSVGFTAKIIAGLTMIVIAIYGIEKVIGVEVNDVLRALFSWLNHGAPANAPTLVPPALLNAGGPF